MHPVWRKEAVFDSLAQAVLVESIAEVEIGVAVFFAPRRRSHAKLRGGLEPIETLTPVALIAGASAMAFVDDY
jgi:hypothetical protein